MSTGRSTISWAARWMPWIAPTKLTFKTLSNSSTVCSRNGVTCPVPALATNVSRCGSRARDVSNSASIDRRSAMSAAIPCNSCPAAASVAAPTRPRRVPPARGRRARRRHRRRRAARRSPGRCPCSRRSRRPTARRAGEPVSDDVTEVVINWRRRPGDRRRCRAAPRTVVYGRLRRVEHATTLSPGARPSGGVTSWASRRSSPIGQHDVDVAAAERHHDDLGVEADLVVAERAGRAHVEVVGAQAQHDLVPAAGGADPAQRPAGQPPRARRAR